MSEKIAKRYEFVLLFDVTDGNPNGDPDAGNLPRQDPETLHGLVTDACLKRKIRNYISLIKGEQEGFEIYIKEKAVLTLQQERAYLALALQPGEARDSSQPEEPAKKSGRKRQSNEMENITAARDWMCRNFWDIRAFGAVMSLKENPCGQVRGPIQVTFARSIDPIVPTDHSITRMAVATAREAEHQGGENRTMGRKSTVPYALYRAYGFVSPMLAEKVFFSQTDLELLWMALGQMFEHDRSAARGLMSTRGLYVFEHDSPLGNASATALFDLINIKGPENQRPRRFEDYQIEVGAPPTGVRMLNMTRQ